MAAKYFVWGEGVWREVDVASGRVSGWRRRARFVFVRRGRLLLARHRPVLRALQALAVGAPGAAADGPRLSHRSKIEPRSKPRHKSPAVADAPPVAPEPPAALRACVHQHHCCAHNRCVDNDKQYPAPRVPATPTPADGSLPRRNKSTQYQPRAGSAAHGLTINVPHATPATATTTSPPTNVVITEADASSASDFESTFKPRAVHTNTSGLNALFERHAPANKKSTRKKDNTNDGRAQRVKKRARAVSSDKTESSSGSEQACKELLVSDGDVAAVRAYVRARFPEALKRFDADEQYKRQLFYSINPLVEVERCARLERLLSQHSAAALPHFAARLGLTPRSDSSASASAPALSRPLRGPASRRRERSASADTDKENKDNYSSPNKVRSEPVDEVKKSPHLRPTPAAIEPVPTRARRQGVSERSNKQKEDVMTKAAEINGDVSDPPNAKRPAPPSSVSKEALVPPGTHVISKRATQPNAKEYSNLEDHAIVAWVSGGARATLVNGNRMWRDLQEQYERLTGRVRSWHSLRNRYLRYILPALGALHLPPAEVSRLRAAAATGAIKTKQRSAAGVAPARHSMYKQPACGAASRRTRAVSGDRADRGDDDTDDSSPPKRRSLRTRPQEAGDTDEGSNDSTSKGSETKAGSSKASRSKEVSSKKSEGKKTGSNKARSPRYSEVTRRFAARHPSRSRSPSPLLQPSPSTRSRRLFNPNV